MKKNKYLIAGIFAILLLSLGGYLFMNARQGSNPMGDTNNQAIVQSHRSYELSDVQERVSALNQPTQIRYKIKNDKGETLKNFKTVHDKIMHFIVVRKDLQEFKHLHPTYNEDTGEFEVDVVFTVDGPYRWFADFTPGDENFMDLPVTISRDINIGDVSNFQAHPITPDTNKEKDLPGNYTVNFTLPEQINSQEEITYTLAIERNGQEVTNLEPYLGALGHSVIIKEDTLDFIHTHALETEENHAMQQHGMEDNSDLQSTSSTISFASNFSEPGVYKIFTQFQHEGKVQTVDYTVKVN